MLKLEIIEHSILIGYAVGYCYKTETYAIYSQHLNDTTTSVIRAILGYHPNAAVFIVTDMCRAMQVSDSPQWLSCINEIEAE